MVFALASRSLRSSSLRPSLAQLSGARRGYAEAINNQLKLSLVVPHKAIYKNQEVTQVNLAAQSGDLGILSAHIPAIEALRPGVVEVIESSGTSKRFFVSSGFATVHPNNSLTINAVEAFPLEDFSIEAARQGLSEAQRVASGSGSKEEKAAAEIEIEVFSAIQSALGQQ
ncbi:delta subunit of the central stalk of mitochondrial F1F0 ATP synthase, atp16 [Malassezia vespertilionis]|uniref:ATP synthase subunit delta, mitochondrial n=1 Tax=Malassezia vespertilionis TaxID=2020962 RepID=A0A2N1JAD5_9BASI|nr:delta subunit of the central stalk of mitochondrial F1F0 ATP synthase, atp16 [Malassezia vespertilionis]PKI83507.1 Atp16p [Malassezia vespertilionis]WFD07285.1 delta subunit of the central stalk of mitochondrial F1F0 ATP synthase, atp16 [Malassezia vespertilionis]